MAHKQCYQRKTSSPGILSLHPLFLICSPYIPSYSVPFSLYWLRQTTLHVEHVTHGWLDAPPVLGKEPYIVCVCWLDTRPLVNIQEEKSVPRVSERRTTGVSLVAALTPTLTVNLSSGTAFALTLSFALFPLFYFTVFPPICHVERTSRQNRTQCGTAVYLNPLMGSMGFAVLLEHWFKASSICQFNKPEAREHRNTVPISSSLGYLCSHFECCIK